MTASKQRGPVGAGDLPVTSLRTGGCPTCKSQVIAFVEVRALLGGTELHLGEHGVLHTGDTDPHDAMVSMRFACPSGHEWINTIGTLEDDGAPAGASVN